MNTKTFKVWQAILSIGEGQWFSQSIISRMAGVHPQTAKRHLIALENEGKLIGENTLYNGRIVQRLWQRPVSGEVLKQLDMFEREV